MGCECSLEGKTAVVTGSDSGIGREIALILAKSGAKVAVSFHSDEEGAAETAKKVREFGVDCHEGHLDVTKEESVARYFSSVRRKLGPVDILVNNAGTDGDAVPLATMDPDQWDKVINVNLRGTFICTQKVLSGMIQRKCGVILNITSVHENIPWANHVPYCAAKAGVAMMTRSLALELQDSGVRVVCLAPGAIRTPMNEATWNDPVKMDDLRDKIPLRRIGEVAEIARMARLIVSDDASYLTGTTVTVDGGMSAYPSFAHGG